MSPICWFVIAWIMPTGMVYTKAIKQNENEVSDRAIERSGVEGVRDREK